MKAIAKTLCSCSRFQRDENWKWHCEAHRWEIFFQISPTHVWPRTEPAHSSDLLQIREFLHPPRALCSCNCSSLQFGQIGDSNIAATTDFSNYTTNINATRICVHEINGLIHKMATETKQSKIQCTNTTKIQHRRCKKHATCFER